MGVAESLALSGWLLAVSGPIEVTMTGDRVAIRATIAPINEVLDRLARLTGMKIDYQGAPPPRQPISATIEDRTPAEAVLSLLEGLGLNYAVLMDASGTRVQTLLMAGVAGPGASSPLPPARPAVTPPVRVPREPPPEPNPEEGMEEIEEIPEGAEGADNPLPGGGAPLEENSPDQSNAPQTQPPGPPSPLPQTQPMSPFPPTQPGPGFRQPPTATPPPPNQSPREVQ